MKRFILALTLLILSTTAYAAVSVSGDLFQYENKHSSFTVEMDASRYRNVSVQVVYSTPTLPDYGITQNMISVANDTVYIANHKLATALPVLLATAPATAPSPLTSGTTYYVVKISDNLIKLATTYAQAKANDPINILTAPAGNWTLKQLPYVIGQAGYLWYGSNDGTNWTGVAATNYTVSTSTQQLTTALDGSNRLFDWGSFPYKFLRFTFNGPAGGVINLRAIFFGKE